MEKKSEDVEVLAELSSCFLIRDDRFLAAYLHIHFHTIWEILKGVFDQSPTFAKEGFREKEKCYCLFELFESASGIGCTFNIRKTL